MSAVPKVRGNFHAPALVPVYDGPKKRQPNSPRTKGNSCPVINHDTETKNVYLHSSETKIVYALIIYQERYFFFTTDQIGEVVVFPYYM